MSGRTALLAAIATLAIVLVVAWSFLGEPATGSLPAPQGAQADVASPAGSPAPEFAPLADAPATPDATPLPIPEFAPGRATAETPPAAWATLTGRVVAADRGQVLTDVELWLLDEAEVGARITSPPRAGTDADGQFRLAIADEVEVRHIDDAVIVGWSATQGLLQHEVGDIVAGPTDLGDLVVHSAGALTGRLVSAFGEPVAGHRVTVERVRIDERTGPVAEDTRLFAGLHEQVHARSGADGVFALRGLPDCTLDLEIARRLDRLGDTRSIRVARSAVTDIGDIVVAPAGSLSGQVLTPEGEPAARAGVSVHLRETTVGDRTHVSGHDRSESMWLGDDARFRFDDLVEGEYVVVGRARGFVFTPVEGVLTGSHDVTVTLRRGGRAHLLVLDAITGSPVPEAELEARIPDVPRPYGVADGTIQVEPGGAPGTWTLSCIDDSGVTVIVRAEGHTTQQLTLPSPGEGGELSHTISLRPQVRIEGLVLDDRRQPIAGAVVQVAPSGDAAVLGTLRADTDADGAFAVPDAPEAALRVWTHADDHVGTTTTTLEDVHAGQTLRLLIGLARQASLRGQVVDARGQPLPDAPVQLLPLEELSPPDVRDPGSTIDLIITSRTDLRMDETVADEQGRFAFERATPGRYLLIATPLTRNEAHRLALTASAEAEPAAWLTAVELQPGDEQDVVLPWLEPRHVGGRVRVEGLARASGQVCLVPTGDGSRAARIAELDERSRFLFEAVPPGDYWVVASVDGFADVRGQRVDVTPHQDADIDLLIPKGRTIRGHVRDPTGRGVADLPVMIHMIHVDPQASSNVPRMERQAARSALSGGQQTRSGVDGAFAIHGLGEGKAYVRASGGAWLGAGQAVVELDGPFDTDPVVVPVRRGASVSGRVVDGAPGMLPTRLSAGIYNADGGGHIASQDVTDGTFSFEGLSEWTVVVRLRDMAPGGGGYVGESRPLRLRAGEHFDVTVVREPED